MARKKTNPQAVNVKAALSQRLREIREDIFGVHGGPEMARRLNIPSRQWYNYETGVTVPAEILLRVIEQTNADPIWLLSGEGPRYKNPADGKPDAELSLADLLRRGLAMLERRPGGDEPAGGGPPSGYVSLDLFGLAGLAGVPDPSSREGEILAMREWIPRPEKTIAVRLTDDAMFPWMGEGAIAAIDISLTDPHLLQGKMAAVRPGGETLIRWLEVSGHHMIFRPNQPSREHPLIPMELGEAGPSTIIGQVVFIWNRVGQV